MPHTRHGFQGHADSRCTRGGIRSPVGWLGLLFIAAALTQAPAAAQVPCSYEVAAIIQAPPGPIHDSVTVATAISPSGEYVVGYFKFDGLGEDRAFAYHMPSSEFRALPLVAGTFASRAMDVNDAGVVVGFIGGQAGDFGFVFDLASDQQTLLSPIHPLGTCAATGINSSNVVCGYRSIGSKTDPVNPFTAFIWSEKDGGFTDLGVMTGPNSNATAIAEDGTVVGWTGGNSSSINTRAFIRYPNQSTLTLPAVPKGTSSAALAVQQANRVAVYGRMTTDGIPFARSFAYFDDSFIDLGVLPGFVHSFPQAVDAHGQIVGYCDAANGVGRAFIWRNGTMIDLSSLITPNANLYQANDISKDGLIIARGTLTSSSFQTVVLAPVKSARGDTNCDGHVDQHDLLSVITTWGVCYGCASDINNDSNVGVVDLLEVIFNWN